ncbi:hypothetical protein [Geodermatophilus sabuli]|uniref:Uncharacterized protein n=1 Tax=Geodermatophilus sabuli TaxID=1564158 RepID=A0A285E644_9ACTN|nr:hypothetical protein [Geodermatophilus sabuli]MBB3082553.1 hypothetical protein [Geodermatophilus sabuli]SNX94579.1 hypothetical protein SAMN06893097_101375 [Geodermatophilus sabuli]
MLVLGKAGSAGVGKGVLPVLRDDVVVATLRASTWKEAATAVVGDREWVLARRKRELTGRWAADPEDTARLRARQTSFWKGAWEADLEGTPVQAEVVSRWKGGHRYRVGGRVVAETGTTGGWSPRPTLTAEESLPLDHQVFLLWLALVMGRRDQAATTAAVTGGAVAGSS